MKIKYIVYLVVITLMTGCEKTKELPYALFDTDRSTYFAGDEIQINNKSQGAGLSYHWDFGNNEISIEENPAVVYSEPGRYTIKLTVEGSTGATEHKRLITVEQPAESIGNIEVNWISSKTFGYITATSPAVDHEGNVVMASGDHILRKFSKMDGSQLWEFDMRNAADGVPTEGGTYAVPAIDTDGTIYMGTGDQSGFKARFYAVNPNGTKKWMLSYGNNGFWNPSGDPLPRINHLNAAIGDNTIYVGNGGSAGTVLAIDKNTGVRKSYVANESNTGPGGGVTTGVLLDKNNNVFWFGGIYGLFRASGNSMDTEARVPWDWRFYTYQNDENVNAAMAIGSDGTIYGLGGFNTVGKALFAVDGNATEEWPRAKWYCLLESVGRMDQGGVVIGPNDVIYGSLKRAVGTEGGGIIAVNTSGAVLWKFGIPQDVSGTPAVDNAGNIHFATDGGVYYIIAPDGETVIFQMDLAELIIRNNADQDGNWAIGRAKCWNSPVIDVDGTIYIGVSNMARNGESVLFSLSHETVAGPANSAWPMRGQNAQRTNRQPN